MTTHDRTKRSESQGLSARAAHDQVSLRGHIGSRPQMLTVYMALCAVTLLTYWPVTGHEFLTYDDLKYVQNRMVQMGLTDASVRWAFSTGYMSNWHPVTWLSHMIDVELFGQHAAGPHVVNVLLHALNAALILAWLHRTTRSLWPSALVAALFALHPLRVESVAWIAERKDVLCVFFGLLAMHAYVRYSQSHSVIHYACIVLWFALSLLAKPMLVTLPFLLLLFDVWPLRRIRLMATDVDAKAAPVPLTWLCIEKLPLLVLACASSVVTFFVQQQGGAMQMVEPKPLMMRLANAVTAYVQYIFDTVWPSGLAVLYPYPTHIDSWHVIGAGLLLTVVSVAVVVQFRRIPFAIVGWFWFLGTLVPVIGIVQIGEQSHADRYTYFPSLGLFILAAWFLAKLPHGGVTRLIGSGAAVVVIVMCLVMTRIQLTHWQNSRTLYERAIAVTRNNYTAHNNLGNILGRSGDVEGAYRQYQLATAINPNLPEAHSSIGDVHTTRGETDLAIAAYQRALSLDPGFPAAHVGLGAAEYARGNLTRAIEHFESAWRRDPETPNIHFNLGVLYSSSGQLDRALAMLEHAARLEPDRTDIREQIARIRTALLQLRDSP